MKTETVVLGVVVIGGLFVAYYLYTRSASATGITVINTPRPSTASTILGNINTGIQAANGLSGLATSLENTFGGGTSSTANNGITASDADDEDDDEDDEDDD